MTELVFYINKILTFGVLVADVGITLWFAMYIFARTNSDFVKFNNIARFYAFPLSFGIALFAIISSLFYSEIAHYPPCVLCWYQRVLIYPQVILLGMAWRKKNFGIAPYIIALSVAGAIIAVYNYYVQVGGSPLIPCGAVGFSVSCAQRFVFEFGYITIPMMSLTAFLIIIISMIILRTKDNIENK